MTAFAKFVFLSGLLCFPALSATAQENGAPSEPLAIITATSYSDLPPSASFSLEPSRSSRLLDQLQTQLEETLPEIGYGIDSEASYGLVFDAVLIAPDFREIVPKQWQLLHLQLTKHAPSRHEFFISIDIYNRKTGIYVWRGYAGRVDETGEIEDIRLPMLDALISAIGKTIPQQPISN